MAKLDSNQALGQPRGKLGGMVFAHQADGSVVIKHVPVRKADFTEAELSNQSRFKRASDYVKKRREHPELQAIYQRAQELSGERVCEIALRDFYRAPQIAAIDLSLYAGQAEQTIRIQALDDVAVAEARVQILDLDGNILEEGLAVQEKAESAIWVYQVQGNVPAGQTVVAVVTVKDWPGNQVTKQVDHALR